MTPKETRFCEEYLLDLCAADAAKRAGYSPKTAKEQGYRLLKSPAVQARITELQAKRSKRTEITADRVLEELGKLGFANMEDYTRLVGSERVVDLSTATRDQLAAVSEMTVEDFVLGRGDEARDVRRVKFKLADKLGALAKIGQHLGMFTEKVELSGELVHRTMTPEELDAREAAILARLGVKKD